MVSFVLSSLNAFCSLSPYSQLPMHSFFVLSYSGLAVLLTPSINRRSKLQIPRKHWISFIFFGAVQAQMAYDLTGSVLTPSCRMMNPKYSLSLWWNSHLDGLTFIPDFRIASRMMLTSFFGVVVGCLNI